MNKDLQEKLKRLPASPGVYFHKSKSDEIIYVGKAAVLKNRVRQYFQDSRARDMKTMALINEIADVDWVETDSEVDALFLESEMVKRYMPRYNILLRDDKSQLYVKITLNDKWPSVSFTRSPIDDGADYFGPYYNGYAVRKALRYLRKSFPYFTSAPTRPGMRSSLNADIGLEPVNMTSSEYKTVLKKLISYLRGNRRKIMNEIEIEMKHAASDQQFEKAATLRNQLRNLQELKRRIMFGDKEFLDISKDRALFQLQDLLQLEGPLALIEGFDVSHTSGKSVVASQVVFRNGVSHRRDYRKYKIKIDKNDDYASIHEAVFRRLSPQHVVSWGKPDLILIDGGKGQLEAALKAADERGVVLPIVGMAKREEMLVIDKRTISQQAVSHIAGLTKQGLPGVRITSDKQYFLINLHSDRLNASGHSRNIRGATLSVYADLLKLLQRIRDESHRFAVSYHDSLRRSGQTKNILEEIPGIGPVTRRRLLKKFGSIRSIMEAEPDQVAEEVGRSKAETITKYLSRSKL